MSRVLLIEPDRILAATYAGVLKDAGFNVTPCASAQAAIFASDQNKPDLIVMEIQLIEHSGIEFLYELRSYPEWQNIPVMIHSQVPPLEFASHAGLLKETLNIQEYLYKPRTSLSELIKKASKYASVTA